MRQSDSIAKLALALAKAQGEMEGAAKDSRNPHFNSAYADLESVVAACRPALAKHDIAYLQSASADANLVRMTTTLLHASGEWIESDPLQVQAKDAYPQAVGSCLTYLRRYQLAAMVGIAPKEDDDANAATPSPEAKTTTVARVPVPAVPKVPTRGVGALPEPPPITDADIPFDRARGR